MPIKLKEAKLREIMQFWICYLQDGGMTHFLITKTKLITFRWDGRRQQRKSKKGKEGSKQELYSLPREVQKRGKRRIYQKKDQRIKKAEGDTGSEYHPVRFRKSKQI